MMAGEVECAPLEINCALLGNTVRPRLIRGGAQRVPETLSSASCTIPIPRRTCCACSRIWRERSRGPVAPPRAGAAAREAAAAHGWFRFRKGRGRRWRPASTGCRGCVPADAFNPPRRDLEPGRLDGAGVRLAPGGLPSPRRLTLPPPLPRIAGLSRSGPDSCRHRKTVRYRYRAAERAAGGPVFLPAAHRTSASETHRRPVRPNAGSWRQNGDHGSAHPAAAPDEGREN
jgi:hypothetical protein